MRSSVGTKAFTGAAAGAVAILALTGCGSGGSHTAADPLPVAAVDTVDYSDFGLSSDDRPGWWDGRRGAWGRPGPRVGWLRGLGAGGAGLHGEMTVQTDGGPRTLVVQRGTVDSIDGSTISVESADGFVLDWTCADECRVIDDGDEVKLSSLDVDAEVGVRGLRDGEELLARIVLRPETD
ncbi:hypothetical protein O7621_17695 [Solwaraspora sp. WMMD937]|uniref:hypothetical protein n=1 Tax=Solwaraspora sp. WMMD937 TaxID=3016090 RepID=UPI00249A6ACF|nr:hypothetical protein [Solwaraspora sp. WMMD937]WFE19760.1 hypothetical protein O7621_17695 [Solwaraspora sp. WMMD937]